jgi:hypothetical protein
MKPPAGRHPGPAVLVSGLLLLVLACKSPFDYEHRDPNLPAPPGPPALITPADGENTRNYAYPQDVTLGWSAVAGAEFYQVEVYRDSVLTEANLALPRLERVDGPGTAVRLGRHGFYWWRVRADNARRWNAPTDWSAVRHFILPNPAD